MRQGSTTRIVNIHEAKTHLSRLIDEAVRGEGFPSRSASAAAEELPIAGQHALAVGHLPDLHRDPFDRMLLAQATAEEVLLLSHDPAVLAYPGPIQAVWGDHGKLTRKD